MAALLLLIPRTALLGAMLYFPIIANICVLTYAVRFEGTRIATLMLLANLFLLMWDYDRLKWVLSLRRIDADQYVLDKTSKFPVILKSNARTGAGTVAVQAPANISVTVFTTKAIR
jgi:hypothetical protein